MAIFNSSKAKKIGVYGTLTMTIGAVIKAINDGRVFIPREQRKMESKNSPEYKKKATAFVSSLLIHAFCDTKFSNKLHKTLADAFGNDVVLENGVPQFIGLSVDENGIIYLSDGQHRFLHYLMDFLNGDLVIAYNTKFNSDFTERAMKELFDCVELAEGDGHKVENKTISIDMLSEEDKAMLMNIRVIAAVVESIDEEERAALFVAMNSCTPIKQHDLANASYGRNKAWQSIESVNASLAAVDCDKNEGVTFECGKRYNANDARILRNLFYAPMSTFVPIVAHAGLLTYLNKKQRNGEYQWLYSSEQSQADQVRNFMKVTENMSREECDKLLVKMMDDIVKIGHKIYEDRDDVMKQAKGMKSLLVGQMHAMHNSGLSKNEFYQIASEITFDLTIRHVYKPEGATRDYTAAYFNNGHKSRSKNELFCKWVMAAANNGGAK